MRTPWIGAAALALMLALSGCGSSGAAGSSIEEGGLEDVASEEGGEGTGTDVVGSETGGEESGEVDTEATESGAESGVDAESGDDVGEEPPPPTQTREEMRSQTLGGERPVNFHLPANVEDASDWPMVIVLHGFSANGWLQDIYLNASQRVTELGIVLLLPDGTPNPETLLFWNATDACCDWYGQGVDDVGYLTGLIDEAIEKLPVDPKRVFLVGHSNGGFMSYRMACDAADRIAGIASIAGGSWKTASKCAPSEPVSVLQIHGTLDWTIPFAGDGNYPSALESALQFVGHDGCSVEGVSAETAWNYDTAVFGDETTRTIWADCDAESEVQLWTMTGTGHIPGFHPDFLPAVVEFFLAHPKP